MSESVATRTELLARRRQIALAEQGRDLLTDKRAALVREFRRLGATVLEAARELERRAVEARATLGEAVAFEGPETVGSAALAAEGEVPVSVTARSVAGVPIVEVAGGPVARPRADRGYSLAATTPRIDAVADAYERMLDLLLEVVAKELSLRRLAAEITATTRRVNALEHAVVPRLESERRRIAMVLEDRELEDRARLMRARSIRVAREAA